jgi:hypothetical protein
MKSDMLNPPLLGQRRATGGGLERQPLYSTSPAAGARSPAARWAGAFLLGRLASFLKELLRQGAGRREGPA